MSELSLKWLLGVCVELLVKVKLLEFCESVDNPMFGKEHEEMKIET